MYKILQGKPVSDFKNDLEDHSELKNDQEGNWNTRFPYGCLADVGT